MGRDAGFSLLELIVAMGIVLAAVASTLTLLTRSQLNFGNEGEAIDIQQRLRVAFHTLRQHVLVAGAGPNRGVRSGRLDSYFAALLPSRQGALNADPAGTFKRDTLSVMYVPGATSSQSTIGQPMPAQSGWVSINLDVGCPPDPACGFVSGMDVVVYDGSGAYDTFRITGVEPGSLLLQHTMADTSLQYPVGATIVEAASYTFFLKADAAANSDKLMQYDGVAFEAAIVDHVVGLSFEYFGEPDPPFLLKPVTDLVGPWTTYGPRPPPLGVQSSQYPPGENCIFQLDSSGTVQIPRLPMLAGEGATMLVALPPSQLADGPWCPDGSQPHRFDADLLRVRRVVVTIRVEAARSDIRGPAGMLFARGGTSRNPNRWVPDREIRFEVSPRNLWR
jgi:prepilin-type N-terminal cleavage/methylation domain-containing protein